MTFPYFFHLFGHDFHPHAVMEFLAYPAGFQLYLFLRRRARKRLEPTVPIEKNLWLIVGAVFGALVGSKVLSWLEHPVEYWQRWSDPATLFAGKTIVGGLIGGWLGVEIAKRVVGVRANTGDLFVFPLILGTCIGRVGCFLTGLDDHTHGIASSLSWAIDFGDGVPRHPTQLYEIVFLSLLACLLFLRTRTPRPAGELFRLFMLGYLAFRFGVEFIKPVDRFYAGLSGIQVACLIGALASIRGVFRLRSRSIIAVEEIVC